MSTLIITDPHFGKDASFRSFGIPVPHGTTQSDLSRLEALTIDHKVRRILILGDFFHSKESLTSQTSQALINWRTRHNEIEVINIRGNHDRHAGDPPKEVNVSVMAAPWILGGVMFTHHPDVMPSGPQMSGHIHPGIALSGAGSPSVKLPCFWVSNNQIVLPAFGGFTGFGKIDPVPGDNIYVIAEETVWLIPTKT
jgi:DNA ligase-associated metallophosphoesterase